MYISRQQRLCKRTSMKNCNISLFLLVVVIDTWTKTPLPIAHVNSWFNSIRTTTCSGKPDSDIWIFKTKKQEVNTTYVLTPWSRVLLEKLTGSAASQEIPHIFGYRMFLTVLTSARHLSLSWATSIQSPKLPPNPWRSILILFSHLCLCLPNGLFTSGFPTRTLCTPLTVKCSYERYLQSVSSRYKLITGIIFQAYQSE